MSSLAQETDMRLSMKYVEQAAPIIGLLMSGWELIPVEGQANEVCRVLDMQCGIDYLLYSKYSGQVYGLASRVQYGRNYRTFTVRKERESGAKTEYKKRIDASTYGGLSPQYTMQAYVKDGEINGLAVVKTEDLLNFIEKGLADEGRTGANKDGQATFYICGWDKLRDAGYAVKEYSQPDGGTKDLYAELRVKRNGKEYTGVEAMQEFAEFAKGAGYSYGEAEKIIAEAMDRYRDEDVKLNLWIL